MPQLQEQVVLTKEEAELFAFLMRVVEYSGCQTTLRVAGGWVRDKLLGKPSDDIDIAADNISGKDFRAHVYRYLEAAAAAADTNKDVPATTVSADSTCGQKRKLLIQDGDLPAAKRLVTEQRLEKGVIQARPEKDLLELRSNETLGRKDSVGARADVTADEEMRMLAAEDAHLRDYTVNAMFYNINAGQVEDYVGGRNDLAEGIIRCPLPWDKQQYSLALARLRGQAVDEEEVTAARRQEGVMRTLEHDSLRLLRGIRFACRFGFEFSEELKAAAADEQVREWFRVKPDPERKAVEVAKALKSMQPVRALRLLCEMDIASSVFPFAVPVQDDLWQTHNEDCCALAHEAHIGFPKDMGKFKHANMLLAAFLAPLCTHSFAYGNGETKDWPMTRESMKTMWKLSKADANQIMDLVESVLDFQRIAKMSEEADGDAYWIALGLRMRVTGEAWRLATALASCLDQRHSEQPSGVQEAYARMEEAMHAHGFLDQGSPVWLTRVILSGKDIKSRFQVNGSAIGRGVALALDWQMVNPRSTDRDQCAAYIGERLQ